MKSTTTTVARLLIFSAIAVGASFLHKIEFSDQAVTFKRLANGEQVSEVKVMGNVARANVNGESELAEIEEIEREFEEYISLDPELERELAAGDEVMRELQESSSEISSITNELNFEMEYENQTESTAEAHTESRNEQISEMYEHARREENFESRESREEIQESEEAREN